MYITIITIHTLYKDLSPLGHFAVLETCATPSLLPGLAVLGSQDASEVNVLY